MSCKNKSKRKSFHLKDLKDLSFLFKLIKKLENHIKKQVWNEKLIFEGYDAK